MKLRVTILAVVVALLSTAIVMPKSANAARPAPSGTLTAAVSGTTSTGTFSGLLTVSKFVTQNGQLMAVGTISNVTQTVDNVTTSVPGTQAVTLPVNTAASTGSCTILDLVIGPISLDLLGLQVTTNTIHLNITAQQGPGNLLGNLLCAVANLLNGGLNLNTLVGLLNQILANL